jgi:O-antigen ligase
MTLAPILRTRLFAAGAALVAVWLSVEIAHGEFFWPGLCAGALGVFLLSRFQPLPLATLVLTTVAVGYVIGNRGFAQVSVSARFPLLPAELALAFCGGLLLVQSAWRHELPFRRDALNLTLLAWMLAGTLRIVFDFREHGFMAIRDFALVYYAAFFFLGQEMAGDLRSRRFFENAFMASCALLLPVFLLSQLFPEFFFNALSWRGNPLIYYKGDLAATFVATGSVLFFLRFEERGGAWRLIVSLVLAGAVPLLNNRAAMLALFVATAWLAIRRRWRFALAQAAAGIIAITAVLLVASALRISWERTPVFGIYERVVSIADPMGQRAYRGDETFNKGDNNLYRTVWWRAVIDETLEGNPYVGLGFGHDLAARFVREYYPESSDEFNVRSPHNVLISIFARMGAIGLVVFLALIGVIAVRTWRALRVSPSAAAPWCAVWVIFTSACFGVVLEGPMGAMVFWTLLGLASGAILDEPFKNAKDEIAALAERTPELASK